VVSRGRRAASWVAVGRRARRSTLRGVGRERPRALRGGFQRKAGGELGCGWAAGTSQRYLWHRQRQRTEV